MGLNLVVLVKQVPDIDKVKFDIEKGRVDRSSAEVEINPFDLNALETALRLKEELDGRITVISMGPLQAELVIRDALSRGADYGVLLTDKKFAGADTLATSYTLASAIKKLGSFDLILCGEKTVDGDTGQVGPQVAQHLCIPSISYVSEIVNASHDKVVVRVDRTGYYYQIEMKLPGLVTVTKDINDPRLPSLRAKLKAKREEIKHLTADDLMDVANSSRFGFLGSPTTISKIQVRSVKGRRGKIFSKDPIKSLIQVLVENKLVEQRV